MSREVFEIICRMDMQDIQTQLALQCAPFIAGLKVSNLLTIPRENLKEIREILKGTGISYDILRMRGKKVTILLYNRRELKKYLEKEEVKEMLLSMGYEENSLEKVLFAFSKRYQNYMKDNQKFPHEMGLLLGYPIEDVKGFINNDGKNYLHIGYWKVYENLSEKLQLFRKFELAKETIIQLVSNGVMMRDIIAIYQEEKLQKAVV